jgi:hypothetical protein
MNKRWTMCAPAWGVPCVVVLGAAACAQGTKPGSLVGSYAVHGVLVENTCGQSALPTANPLDFVVEIRTDSGVAYWIPSKAAQNSGTLNDSGSFRFTMSETQVVNTGMTMRQPEPSDFLSAEPDFDLQQQRTRTCALTRKQTVQGKLARLLEDGVVNKTPNSSDSDDAKTGAFEPDADDDLSAEHAIQVAPSAGSDCTGALAALGGSFLALPCEARYVLSGSLDTSGATSKPSKPSDSGADADSGE